MPESQIVITGLAAITTVINICFLSQFDAIEFPSQHRDLVLLKPPFNCRSGSRCQEGHVRCNNGGRDKGGPHRPFYWIYVAANPLLRPRQAGEKRTLVRTCDFTIIVTEKWSVNIKKKCLFHCHWNCSYLLHYRIS